LFYFHVHFFFSFYLFIYIQNPLTITPNLANPNQSPPAKDKRLSLMGERRDGRYWVRETRKRGRRENENF